MDVGLKSTFETLARPVDLIRNYRRSDFQPDLVAGLTVAILLLPQAIAYALIAELPAEMGLYSAILAAIVGGLWGSSKHLHTGPTNATSLLVLGTLLAVAQPGTPEFLTAAAVLTVMVGLFRLLLGLGRLGVLVNFVSDSVVIGFTAGAAVLIAVNQIRHLLRLDFPSSPGLAATFEGIVTHINQVHWPTLALGSGVIGLLVILLLVNPKLPGPLIAMLASAVLVALLGLTEVGVQTIGEIPRSLPPFSLPRFSNFRMIADLSSGALAVGALGLVEAVSTARAISAFSGQRLDSNQEFVGQGLACLVCGLFSGYTPSGSPSRSVVNYRSGARTQMAGVFSGLFVLAVMLVAGPLTRYLPRAALAGVLIFIAFRMVDRAEVVRIWRGTRGDAFILVLTTAGTLLLPLHFAVLTGILISFAVYIMRTSVPRVVSIKPDDNFRHLVPDSPQPDCTELAIFDVLGDLYFGAVNHVENMILEHFNDHPSQRILLIRMRDVHHLDISGVHVLESLARACRERGGDMYLTWVRPTVMDRLERTGFVHYLGEDHFLDLDDAVSYLFYHVIDPAICIYECPVRTFRECQNLPKRAMPEEIRLHKDTAFEETPRIKPGQLWKALHGPQPPHIIDVREPREFAQGHIPEAHLIPLPELIHKKPELPGDGLVVFVCRGGRRSTRAAHLMRHLGYTNAHALEGGMLAWEAAGLLEAVDKESSDDGQPVP